MSRTKNERYNYERAFDATYCSSAFHEKRLLQRTLGFPGQTVGAGIGGLTATLSLQR
jgi:hypothetical protein